MILSLGMMQSEVRQGWSSVEGSRNGEVDQAGPGHQLGLAANG